MKTDTIKKIQKVLLAWHTRNARVGLPWRRKKDRADLYRIVLSEIMLQQTNVPKVKTKYKEFLATFPTAQDLASAQQSDVLRAWRGLGYNRRALHLHRSAKIVMEKYAGKFPETVEELLELPGIGPYTSKAILVFGRNTDLVARDVNVDRLLGRLRSRRNLTERSREKLAQQFLPPGKARVWHEALMDFASAICTKHSPQCTHCLLKRYCASYPCLGTRVKKKKEIGRSEHGKHVPRRIYRGRIIEFLRTKSGQVEDIGPMIKSDWHTQKDHRWLEEILKILAREGLITQTKKHWSLKK